ncbi:MAG TPA: hypothetical protein PLO37_13590 [Candidatus Hydrogenedentes bacterium]|nr:hypothetical protein [Candidatus Hydrogenedentota bacterium]HPG67877.1 hypothetical protein [Candidatus Hydrogenedentota bacterium]
MQSLPASKILMVDGVDEDPRTRARAERLRAHMPADEVRHVSDEELNGVFAEILPNLRRHGMNRDIKPVVVFNRFRFDDPEEVQAQRIEAYPWIRDSKLNGYGGFDWRPSGSSQYRRETGLVCQPAWHIHTVVGCHFRCAYCNLGWFVNVMLNLEDYVDRLDDNLARCPEQRLFQWDNYTDVACWEPEYGCAKLLIDYFAGRRRQALLLYVGKSDHVDYLLDYDHRGHTVCCWSLSGRTQSAAFERGSASMEARIESMRKCQEAGYPVRVRLSPIIPVRNWREENRAMLEYLFERVKPDVVTMETIRFLDYGAMCEAFDLALLDEGLVRTMREAQGAERLQGCELPHAYREKVYAFIINEMERLSPETPFAFCRATAQMWRVFEPKLAQHGQTAKRYFCNCGPHCAPATAV